MFSFINLKINKAVHRCCYILKVLKYIRKRHVIKFLNIIFELNSNNKNFLKQNDNK